MEQLAANLARLVRCGGEGGAGRRREKGGASATLGCKPRKCTLKSTEGDVSLPGLGVRAGRLSQKERQH